MLYLGRKGGSDGRHNNEGGMFRVAVFGGQVVTSQPQSITEGAPLSGNKIKSKELAFRTSVTRGTRGKAVRRVQEWLCLDGHAVAVDGVFGPATEVAVQAFCETHGLPTSNEVNQEIFEVLSAPMWSALDVPSNLPNKFGDAVVAIAQQHLNNHPREVGGENKGPWVRLYMDGNEGRAWLWCAGFVSFVIRQAGVALGQPVPFPKTYSCDTLAANGANRNLFIAERDINQSNSPIELPSGTVFLNRRTLNDWDHTGFVIAAEAETFVTIEGNTDHEGSSKGYEVCARTRGYANKDFVLLSR